MGDPWADLYHAVREQDFSSDPPSGYVQWKGTNVCADLYCDCGHHGHVDCEFFYYYECPQCHAKYSVGETIKLIKLTEDQIRQLEALERGHYQTDTVDDGGGDPFNVLRTVAGGTLMSAPIHAPRLHLSTVPESRVEVVNWHATRAAPYPIEAIVVRAGNEYWRISDQHGQLVAERFDAQGNPAR